MINNLYIKIRSNFLGANLDSEKDLFEKMKTELVFNLTLLFSTIYLLGFIKLIINGYWSIFLTRVIGFLLIIVLFRALKKTDNYHIPIRIWVIIILLLGIQGLFISKGVLTFSNLGFALLNISVIALLLNKVLKIVFFTYYVIFISFGLAVTYKILPALNIGVDFSYDQQFHQGNIFFSLVPFLLLIYVLYSFISYEHRVKEVLIRQIDHVLGQEEKIKLANESMYRSIQFASRIQKTFLPNLKIFKNYYQDSFVLLKPKYELSGDFYWSCENEENFYLAIIDSSENNISGAIVSSIYFDTLDFAVKRKSMTSTNEIICYLNKIIEKKADIGGIKEGVNISIIRINKSDQKVHFSSEKNALYFANKTKKVIDQYRAGVLNVKKNNCTQYREYVIDYNRNDIVYLMSDGFAKQFDGFENIKFKESVFKGFLTGIKQESLTVQKELLTNKLELWNKERLQSDDVCLIGLKL